MVILSIMFFSYKMVSQNTLRAFKMTLKNQFIRIWSRILKMHRGDQITTFTLAPRFMINYDIKKKHAYRLLQALGTPPSPAAVRRCRPYRRCRRYSISCYLYRRACYLYRRSCYLYRRSCYLWKRACYLYRRSWYLFRMGLWCLGGGGMNFNIFNQVSCEEILTQK